MPFIIPVLLSTAVLAAQHAPQLSHLLDRTTTVSLTLEAPLRRLFGDKHADNDSVTGTVSYKDSDSGADVVVRGVEVSVRGHTSRSDAECSFPKLKLKAKPGGTLRIGTHCGDEPDDQLTQTYGRLADQKSPLREGLTYRILYALGIPALRTRPARVTYVDPETGDSPLVRNALLIEDDKDAGTRVGGTAEIPLESFGNVQTRHGEADASRIAFGEAAIANFDWCLKYAADDVYRCDDRKPLWNIVAFARNDGRTSLLMKDFDLAGTVVGHHPWFRTVFNPAFAPSQSETEIEVIAQVQRTRALLSRAELDALRRDFMARRKAAYAAVDSADVDPIGRQLGRSHLDAFFAALSDNGFYQPVVSLPNVRVFRNATRTSEACGVNDIVRVGTPVRPIARSSTMSQVILLDAMWRWGPQHPCHAILAGPVWIESVAITSQFPPR